MSSGLLLSLLGLALLDSTSVGTLFIPVWLMLAPGRVRAGRILVYLATIAIFYFAVGLAIVWGAGSATTTLGGVLDTRIALWIQLGIGVGLFALSFRFDSKRRKQAGVSPWRQRAEARSSSAGWLVGLALLAALAEVATMLPYLGAIAMITSTKPAGPLVPALLAGYCLVMVLPAGVLLAGRITGGAWIDRLLVRLNIWITEKAGGALGWILGIAGFLITRDAVVRLWFPHLLGD